MVKHKFGQNIDRNNQHYETLIHAKNKYIVINDTDKSMGTEDKDKTDVI